MLRSPGAKLRISFIALTTCCLLVSAAYYLAPHKAVRRYLPNKMYEYRVIYSKWGRICKDEFYDKEDHLKYSRVWEFTYIPFYRMDTFPNNHGDIDMYYDKPSFNWSKREYYYHGKYMVTEVDRHQRGFVDDCYCTSHVMP